MAILDIRNLQKTYGSVEVLHDINLEMAPGDFLVLVGPSGCGKSTLLNCIAGLEPISGGRVEIAGRDVTGVSPKDRDIAMVFQSYALYPTMTVARNITFGMQVRGVDKATQQAKLEKVAAQLEIGHLLDRKPGQLSGGQRQRVAMGRALVRDPALFLFDEPLSNLDAKLRVSMRTEIKKLHRDLNASIVYVTHDQIEAMTLATRIVVMKGGVIQQIGTPDEIYSRPANMFVADFMGSPAMNLIPARATPVAEGSRLEIERAGAAPLVLTTPARELPANVVLGVRPEDIHEASDTGHIPAAASAPASIDIDIVESAGADIFAVMMLGGKEVTARLRSDSQIKASTPHDLIFDLARLRYFDPETGLRIDQG